jgi:hypothetical protein
MIWRKAFSAFRNRGQINSDEQNSNEQNSPTTPVVNSSPSAPERAIQSSAQDKLERSFFIERLASALVYPKSTKSTGVVVGITGPWGSGKSSILNLLQEYIQAKYPEAIVVRFDPWLVSGRNDLVAEFLGELIGTINADAKRRGKYKKIGETIAQYGAQLAPVANLLAPGFAAAAIGGFQADRYPHFSFVS